MAGSVNKVILVGNLGRDPEVRHGQNGAKIVTLSIATSESWKDRTSGERREKTEWHRVVIFNPNLADAAEHYLRKGSKAYLEGTLQTRKWTDQTGVERYTTEVVIGRFRGELTLLDSRGGGGAEPPPYDPGVEYGGGGSPSGGAAARGSGASSGSAGGGGSGGAAGWDRTPDLDDEIPF